MDRIGKLLQLPAPPTASQLAENELEWARIERELAAASAREASHRRADRLDAAREVCLTDSVRRAIVLGDGLVATRALEAVRDWTGAFRSRPWMLLSGGTGSGKSVAAAWAIAELGGVWIRAERLVRVFAASFGDQYDEQERLRECRFLVLDDVGSESDAARMSAALTELLDARKSVRRATLVTTNLGKPALRDRYGNERLLSRLRESARWEPVVGDDMRGTKSEQR